jgi:hypothetical protein
MCISLHYFFVATGYELIRIKKKEQDLKIKLEYFFGIPYVVTIRNKHQKRENDNIL